MVWMIIWIECIGTIPILVFRLHSIDLVQRINEVIFFIFNDILSILNIDENLTVLIMIFIRERLTVVK